ncbi:GNAT family N-acetyltransferase [bacterium]|nr:GNAT family N-acetyltransferase [bacterium]
MAGPLSFDLVEDDAGFDRLAGEWASLLADSPADPLFSSHAWCRAWWRHYGAGHMLRLAIARDEDGRLVGLAPMYRRTMTARELEREMVGDVRVPIATRGGAYRVLQGLGNGENCSDLLGFIAANGRVDEVWSALYGFLSRDAGDWDILDLADADDETPGLEALQYAAMSGRVSRYRVLYGAPYADLPGGYDAYLDTLSKKSRYNARKKVKQIGVYHKIGHRYHEDPATLPAAMTRLFELHEERWKAEGGSEAFATDAMRAFHREYAAGALSRGELRLGFLDIDGEPAFVTYAIHAGNRYYLYQQGGSSNYPKYNLGYAALSFSLQDACARGAKRYEFLRGEAEYKLHWSNGSRRLVQFLSGRTIAAMRFFARAFINTDPAVRRTLKRVIERGRR